jgi:hypothetical protein
MGKYCIPIRKHNKRGVVLKINIELYGSIDSGLLPALLEKYPELKGFAEHEDSRTLDDKNARQTGCTGCGGGCCNKSKMQDIDYLTSALSSIFDYYLPDDVRNSLHISSTIYVED